MEPPNLSLSAVARWAAALTLLASIGFAGTPGNLSGNWKLNHELSDDPLQKREEAIAKSGGARPPGGGPRGRRSGNAPEDARPDPLVFFESLDFLKIDHQDPKLVITDAAGREHVLSTDGHKIEEERSAGVARVKANWEDGHVVVRTVPERGPSLTETYSAAADGSQLTVLMEIEGRGRMPDITIRRVYDFTTETPPSATSKY